MLLFELLFKQLKQAPWKTVIYPTEKYQMDSIKRSPLRCKKIVGLDNTTVI